jgi:hypothetical protein
MAGERMVYRNLTLQPPEVGGPWSTPDAYLIAYEAAAIAYERRNPDYLSAYNEACEEI